MQFIPRLLDLADLMQRNSYFLLGPRGTGKSFLIRNSLDLSQIDYINLLDSKVYLLLQNQPSALKTLITKPKVVIDEIQRVPQLLNEVHQLIEVQKITFLLTGSSARKLRREGVNLLAGRAYNAELFSFTWKELNEAGLFDLGSHLLSGSLPRVSAEQADFEYLYAYVDNYLKQEVQAESLVRSLPNYIRFLEAAGQMNGQMINFTKIASDAELSPNTVRDYFQILQDTLLAYMVVPWTKSKKRKAIQTAKFYFSDIGVAHALNQIESLPRKSDLYGRAFEHFMANELRAYLSYRKRRVSLQYWRSRSQMEVDFVLGDEIAIEVKASQKINERDLKGLKAIAEEKKWHHLLLVSQDTQTRNFPNGIQQIYWETFLEKLWADHYF